jgi:restriction endonuclease S subunit
VSDITKITNWKELTLDNQIISKQSGFAFALKNTVTEGIPHLRPFNIGNNGQLDLSKIIFLPKESVNDLQQYQLQPGDILFNHTNSVELVGKSALINSSMEFAFSNHLTRLRVRDTNLLDPAWLALYLYFIWRNGFFAEQCHKWIGQAVFNATELASLQIPLPPIKTQQRIIARVETLLADLQEARNILDEMHRDIDQVLNSASFEVFKEVSKNTEPVLLGPRTTKIGSGSTPRGANYAETGIPFIRSLNVLWNKFTDKDLKFISPNVHNHMRGTEVRIGDVLLNITGASIGRSCCPPEKYLPANVNQHVTIIRPTKELQSRFLMYWLTNPDIQPNRR